MRIIRSLLFLLTTFGSMAILGILFAIPALLSRKWAYIAIHYYTGFVIKSAEYLVGIKTEIRGEIPQGNVVIASKHQSFFDVIIHAHYLENFIFIMKQELRWAPILGFYAMRIGAPPVKRGKGGKSVEQMMSGVSKRENSGQLVIYPQGTRVPPGQYKPYKVGAGVIAQRTGRPVALAATNVGLFWPKRGFMKNPGTAVVEYMEFVPDGLELEPFVAYMEEKIEARSNALMAEAGFKAG